MGTIRRMLERNSQTLADAKIAARDLENIDNGYGICGGRKMVPSPDSSFYVIETRNKAMVDVKETLTTKCGIGT